MLIGERWRLGLWRQTKLVIEVVLLFVQLKTWNTWSIAAIAYGWSSFLPWPVGAQSPGWYNKLCEGSAIRQTHGRSPLQCVCNQVFVRWNIQGFTQQQTGGDCAWKGLLWRNNADVILGMKRVAIVSHTALLCEAHLNVVAAVWGLLQPVRNIASYKSKLLPPPRHCLQSRSRFQRLMSVTAHT